MIRLIGIFLLLCCFNTQAQTLEEAQEALAEIHSLDQLDALRKAHPEWTISIKKTLSEGKIFLKYANNKPVINNIKTISKPGRRIYYSIKQIRKIDSNKNFIIISTNKGVITDKTARTAGIGGEVVCTVS